MKKFFEFAPAAIDYLEEHHSRLWYRSDYLTNNVSESFNSQIKHLKGLNIHELVDRIRELIMEKRYIRKMLSIPQDWGTSSCYV